MRNAYADAEVDDAPVSAALSMKKNRYGSVPGLDDEELASPEELERQVLLEEWGPVLALPVRGRRNPIQPVIDENGGLDWGAFGLAHGNHVKAMRSQHAANMQVATQAPTQGISPQGCRRRRVRTGSRGRAQLHCAICTHACLAGYRHVRPLT
jgi:hypothetical protein